MKWSKRPMTGLHTLIRSELIELIETLEAERDEFAKEIRHLSLRQSDLLTERDRYREALEEIAFSDELASYIAEQALEKTE